MTPRAGSTAVARVLVGRADCDNYLFCEVRIGGECAELQLGRRFTAGECVEKAMLAANGLRQSRHSPRSGLQAQH